MRPLNMKWITCLASLVVALNSGCDQKSMVAVSNGEQKISGEPLPDHVTFNAHIRPIFSNTCFACHGFDAKTREADLRLDTPEGGYAKLKDSEERAIVPGKPDQSAIMQRIFATDPDDVMPPPDFHKDLTAQQKSLIRAWIEQGAKYEQHWAFTPVVRAPVPALAAHAEEVANPIDAFVLATLEAGKIAPSPLALAIMIERVWVSISNPSVTCTVTW